jgi:prophage regulatory protein
VHPEIIKQSGNTMTQQSLVNITHQIIRHTELLEMIKLSRSTVYDIQNPKSSRFDPSFPQRIRLGSRAVGWLKAEVEKWLDSRRTIS